MTRLYKFFGILLLIILVVSYVYATAACWIVWELLKGMALTEKIAAPGSPIKDILEIGLGKGLIFSLALFLTIIFLMKISYDRGQRFTIKNIGAVAAWFYLLNTCVFTIYCLTMTRIDITLQMVAGPEFMLPPLLWLPFPIAWIALFIISAARISKRIE